MHEPSTMTPMFRQYRALKGEHADAILLFRMGDFYEMFYEDARDASRILELTLTARGKGTAHAAPMCGFPHHQIDAYTAKLVRAGRRVAVCDQVEDPRKAKGLVRREVVRVVTPGTITDPEQLDAKEPNWIASIAAPGGRIGAAFLEVSTGAFVAWSAPDPGEGEAWPALLERLQTVAPREIVHPEDLALDDERRRELSARALLTPSDPFAFAPQAAADTLARHFDVAGLEGFGLAGDLSATAAAGGLITHLRGTLKNDLQHVDSIALHRTSEALVLDRATRRNLEIDRSIREDARAGSLLGVVDATTTSPGARLLREWLLAPLRSAREIARRHDAVEELAERADLRETCRDHLGRVRDIERLLGRAVAGSATPRDLVALRASLEEIPAIRASLASAAMPLLVEAVEALDPCADIAAHLARALVDDPPPTLRDGGIVRDGFDASLDELRAIRRDGRSYIATLEAREREATGIASLKVRYNKVFGYYLEVSKANLHLVPEHYRRKQTIAGGERYVTPELTEYETKVLHAQERIEAIEVELFGAVRAGVAAAAPRLKATARSAALLDVLAALAHVATRRGWRRPVVDDSTVLRIVGGRHPVVEATLGEGRFVPNDTALDTPSRALAILTGPNMGGKSTYLRQVALIALLAQAGSFVPADEAHIGLVDRIFCRVGASDSLADGQSTFMVEMTETANILHQATPRSLVLLDEIGRGTATFDGLAIAWAVVEHLHALAGGAPRTLFATHYHELTELAVTLEGVANLRMAVREWGDRVVFTHRVEDGAADRSYGIHVARLAGIPPAVVARAREILGNLERDEFGGDGLPRRARRGPGGQARRPAPTLFPPPVGDDGAGEPVDPASAEVLAEIRARDPERLTPLEALQLIDTWTRRLRGGPGVKGPG